MKKFLKESFIEPFQERETIGYIVGCFVWSVALTITGLCVWLCLWLIDSSFLPEKQAEGIVTKKYYVPAHTTTTFIQSDKTMIPITTFQDTEYDIVIDINGLTDNVSLYQDSWNYTNVGDSLCCKYTNGRILNSMYVKSFCK